MNKDRRCTITTEQRKRIRALGQMDITYREIASKVGCASSTVSGILQGKTKDKRPGQATPLSKFHEMEKSVNHLKTPADILNVVPHPNIVELHQAAKNALDVYVATLGAFALDQTMKQKERTA